MFVVVHIFYELVFPIFWPNVKPKRKTKRKNHKRSNYARAAFIIARKRIYERVTQTAKHTLGTHAPICTLLSHSLSRAVPAMSDPFK